MPSQPDVTRLCFIGDSQLGSLQSALKEGLTTVPNGIDVEFWGATGPAFRGIYLSDGAMCATGTAKDMATTINAKGRDRIAPGDFDTLVFYGARLRMPDFFGPLLDWAHTHGDLPSRRVLQTSAEEFVRETRAFRMAQAFAREGDRVLFVPGPLTTEGVVNLRKKQRVLHHYPGAIHGTIQWRDRLWSALEDVSASAGIEFIRQPEDTITKGILTKNEYACANARETEDTGHKSPAFAVRWMQEVWPHLEQKVKVA
ncbi:hypothetical protein [Ascidiaceihabitans sp.]|uniref:hypothetical protein n=1 Tax=Ascidiaceihabitans sp. TaxID=1872644 RepID=UPI003299EE6D